METKGASIKTNLAMISSNSGRLCIALPIERSWKDAVSDAALASWKSSPLNRAGKAGWRQKLRPEAEPSRASTSASTLRWYEVRVTVEGGSSLM